MDADEHRTATDPVPEDFSVYIAPAASGSLPPVGDDELLERLEPTLGIVWLPLLLLLALALLPFPTRRYHLPDGFLGIHPWNARYVSAGFFLLMFGVGAIPYALSASYFAELYGDRLVVRRGKREWATPLEEITQIDVVARYETRDKGPLLLTLLDFFATFANFRDLTAQNRNERYIVETRFGSTFSIPPFPAAEDFVTRVYQRRAEVLAQLPPIVRGTEHDEGA